MKSRILSPADVGYFAEKGFVPTTEIPDIHIFPGPGTMVSVEMMLRSPAGAILSVQFEGVEDFSLNGFRNSKNVLYVSGFEVKILGARRKENATWEIGDRAGNAIHFLCRRIIVFEEPGGEEYLPRMTLAAQDAGF